MAAVALLRKPKRDQPVLINLCIAPQLQDRPQWLWHVQRSGDICVNVGLVVDVAAFGYYWRLQALPEADQMAACSASGRQRSSTPLSRPMGSLRLAAPYAQGWVQHPRRCLT